MMTSDENLQPKMLAEFIRRLDAILALLAQESNKGVGRTVLTLSDAGLRPKEIASILGKTQSYVNKELAIGRKERRKRNKNSPQRGER